MSSRSVDPNPQEEPTHEGKSHGPVSRETLYAEVWAEPMLKVAARYNVSSSFMARVCTRLNVPRPPVGYWAKVAVGKAPKQPPLPEAQLGDELEWTPGGTTQWSSHRVPKVPEAPIRPRGARTKQPSRAGKHPLLVNAEELFVIGRETQAGYLKPHKRLLMDLVASRAGLSRGLEIASRLYDTFESRGHRVVLAPGGQHWPRHEVDEREDTKEKPVNRWVHLWSPGRPTLVSLGSLGIGITIFEMSENVEVESEGVTGRYIRKSEVPESKRKRWNFSDWVQKADMPSGRFCIQAYVSYYHGEWVRQWREKKAGDIDSRLLSIVKELECEAPAIVELVAEGHRQAEIERQRWQEQMENWRREEDEHRRQEALKASQADLLAIINAWAEATRIEAFFLDAESRAADLREDERAALLERLARARQIVGGIDALERFREWRMPEERLTR